MSDYKTKDILVGLNHQELIALRRRASWCDVDWYPTRDAMLTAMARSASGAISNGDLTVTELVQEIKNEVIYKGPNKIETQIQEVLRDTIITRVARGGSHSEKLACAHLTGALQEKLGTQFRVEQEKIAQGSKKFDIHIKNKNTGEEYLIEAKVENRRITGLPDQLSEYHKLLKNRVKTYVVFLVFDDKYWEYYNCERYEQLNKILGEEHIKRIKNVDDHVEIILNWNIP